MAFYSSNNNVGLRALVINNEILLVKPELIAIPKDDSISKLKCPSNISTKSSDKEFLDRKLSEVESKQSYITSVAVSNCNNFIAACDSSSSLVLWRKKESNWDILSSRSIARKCQKVIFTNSVSDIILTDRGGDVFSFSVSNFQNSGKFLLGHICLILDLAISSSDKYLATCDRDSKIKVSSYPNCYNIVNYCLGHQEFVSSVQFLQLETGEVLLSSSGDSTLRMWKDFNKESTKHYTVHLHKSDALGKICNIGEGNDSLNGKLESHTGAGNLVLSENQILFSVRCVKYNSKYRLFVVIFHLQPGIAIYKLSENDDTFEFKQFIYLSTPLDAMFTTSEKLLILSQKDVNPMACYCYEPSTETFSAIKEDGLEHLQKFYEGFQGIPFQEDFVSLFKRVYDELNDQDGNDSKSKKNKKE